MVEEYTSIMKNNLWDIVPRLKGKSVVSSRWVYKIEHREVQSEVCGERVLLERSKL